MHPALDSSFLNSPKWAGLSKPAQCALQGLLQFAQRRHCDWVVEGTPKQLGDWIGPEANLSSANIVEGLRELNNAGCIRRGRTRSGVGTSFVLQAPIVER